MLVLAGTFSWSSLRLQAFRSGRDVLEDRETSVSPVSHWTLLATSFSVATLREREILGERIGRRWDQTLSWRSTIPRAIQHGLLHSVTCSRTALTALLSILKGM